MEWNSYVSHFLFQSSGERNACHVPKAESPYQAAILHDYDRKGEDDGNQQRNAEYADHGFQEGMAPIS
jgi:hypothetical protein